MYITLPSLVLIIIVVLIFAKSSIFKEIILYTEELVEINTSEDRLNFHKRANEIAAKLDNLGNVRVKDLKDLFEKKSIPTARKEAITNNQV